MKHGYRRPWQHRTRCGLRISEGPFRFLAGKRTPAPVIDPAGEPLDGHDWGNDEHLTCEACRAEVVKESLATLGTTVEEHVVRDNGLEVTLSRRVAR